MELALSVMGRRASRPGHAKPLGYQWGFEGRAAAPDYFLGERLLDCRRVAQVARVSCSGNCRNAPESLRRKTSAQGRQQPR